VDLAGLAAGAGDLTVGLATLAAACEGLATLAVGVKFSLEGLTAAALRGWSGVTE